MYSVVYKEAAFMSLLKVAQLKNLFASSFMDC